MQVFISWSGPRSGMVARALDGFLRDVLQYVRPFYSPGIEGGRRWSGEIAEALENSKFAVCCVTPENQSSAWMNFEAGACAKSVEDGRVCPFLFDLEPANLLQPLGAFQAKRADRDGTLELVMSINAAAGPGGLPDLTLRKQVDRCWPELQDALHAVPPMVDAQAPPLRSSRSILEELLERVRNDDPDRWGRWLYPGMSPYHSIMSARSSGKTVDRNDLSPLPLGWKVVSIDEHPGRRDILLEDAQGRRSVVSADTRHGYVHADNAIPREVLNDLVIYFG